MAFAPLQDHEVEILYMMVGETWFQDHHNSPRNHYKAIEHAMRYWCDGCVSNHPRYQLSVDMWRWMKINYPRAFENLNKVPKYLWIERYRERVEAVRNCFMNWGLIRAEWQPFTQHFKRCPQISGKRVKYVIADNVGPLEPGTYQCQITEVAEIDGNIAVKVKMNDIRQFNWDSGWEDCNEHDQEVIAMFKNVKTLRCQFQGDSGTSRLYDYLTDDESVAVDDLAIVESNGSTNIVKVKEVVVGMSDKATKWIVQKVDFTGYKDKLKKIAEAKEIKRLLDEAVERKRRLIDYEKIAEGDSEMQELLAKLKALQS